MRSLKGVTARQAIGHKELEPYFTGNASLEECAESIKRETRRYAKRQLTWFRRNEKIKWFYADKMTREELYDCAEKEAKRFLAEEV
jgi:tRNA dimethylallyltransferase